jgi:hypothetical protein
VVDGGGGVALGELGDRRSGVSGTIWRDFGKFGEYGFLEMGGEGKVRQEV